MVGADMELRHLRYFVAVAEEQNVTRAAARLHVSQPPLTRQIHDLEAELGLALFERTGKAIRLTEAGRVFLEEAKASLKRVEDGVKAARAAALCGGELHLGYAPSPTMEILPKLLRAFRRTAPSAQVTLHDHTSPEMLAGLREGQLQAALMMQPAKLAGRGVKFEPLRAYPIVAMTPPEHSFSRLRAVPLDAVLREPIVAYSRAEYPDYHKMLARIFGAKVKRLRLAAECDSGTSLIAAVESGKGVNITSSILAATAGRRLRYVPLEPPPAPAVVGIAFRVDRVTPLTRRLIETARALAAEQ